MFATSRRQMSRKMKTTVWHATATSTVNEQAGGWAQSQFESIIIILFSDTVYIIPTRSSGRIIMRSSASDSSVQRVPTHILHIHVCIFYNCITSIILYCNKWARRRSGATVYWQNPKRYTRNSICLIAQPRPPFLCITYTRTHTHAHTHWHETGTRRFRAVIPDKQTINLLGEKDAASYNACVLYYGEAASV